MFRRICLSVTKLSVEGHSFTNELDNNTRNFRQVRSVEMHRGIRRVVHIVTKRSNDPELSISQISILRNHSEVRHQARSAGDFATLS